MICIPSVSELLEGEPIYVFIAGAHIVFVSVVKSPISSSRYTADMERFGVTFCGFPLISEMRQHSSHRMDC